MNLIEIVSKYKIELDNLYKNGFNKSSLPGYEKGSIRSNEASMLYSLIREYKFKNILDIGTGKGFSALVFCKALQDENLDGFVDSIDINQNFSYEIFQKFDLEKYFRFYQGNSNNVVPTLNKIYDFILVDGDHDYTTTRNDFINIFDKLRVGGLCIFHDVYQKPLRDGPRAVLEEIEKEQIGKIIYFTEELFDYFSYPDDIQDAKRMWQKWQSYNFSYVSRDANPKELMAMFIKEKETLSMKIQTKENKDEEFLQEWMK